MPRSRLVVLVAAVVVVVVVASAGFYLSGYAGGNNTISTVTTPANLVAATGQLPQTSCGGQTYSNKSLSIDWGNLAPGTEGIQYLCLENTGTTAVALAVASSLSPSVGRVTSPQSGTILNGEGIEMIELDLWLSSSAQTGPVSPFTITIGGSS